MVIYSYRLFYATRGLKRSDIPNEKHKILLWVV